MKPSTPFRIFILALTLVLTFPRANGQFVLNGGAADLGGDCFQMTPDLLWQVGSVWHPTLINLEKDFAVRATVNFGSKDINGADGIAFLLQPISTAIGVGGGGMGYEGISPSLAVEFDTYENVPFLDPFGDHIGIQRNGVLDHGSTSALISPVNISAVSSNIEDGTDHTILIRWDAATTTLTVEFDCSVRASYTGDIVSTIFSGDPSVFIGFTSSTGGLSNLQSLCFDYLEVGEGPEEVDACIGAPVMLDGPNDFINYNWTPATGLDDPTAENPMATVFGPTLYVVSFDDACGNTYTDSFQVVIADGIEVDLGPDTVLCDGATIDLNAPPGLAATYLWSTGEVSSSINVGPGTHWVTVTPAATGCPGTDTIVISDFSLATDLGVDTSFCPGDSVLISVTPNPDWDYSWSTGDLGPETWVSSPGTLTLTVDWDACSSMDMIEVTEAPLPVVELPDSTAACQNTLLQLSVSGDADSWLWSTGNTGQEISVLANPDLELVWVEGTLNGCVNSDTLYIYEPESCSCQPQFPNAFSPNRDGLNDLFRGLNLSACPPADFYDLQVFNRWGELVFQSRLVEAGWDGTFKGKASPIGTYVWIARFRFPGESESSLKGTVTLVR